MSNNISAFEEALCNRIVTVCNAENLADERSVQLAIAPLDCKLNKEIEWRKNARVSVDNCDWEIKLEDNKCWGKNEFNYCKTEIKQECWKNISQDELDRLMEYLCYYEEPSDFFPAAFDLSFKPRNNVNNVNNSINLLEIKKPKTYWCSEVIMKEVPDNREYYHPFIKANEKTYGTDFHIGAMFVDMIRMLSFSKLSRSNYENVNLYFAAFFQNKEFSNSVDYSCEIDTLECIVKSALKAYNNCKPKFFFTRGKCCEKYDAIKEAEGNKKSCSCDNKIRGKHYDIWPHPDPDHALQFFVPENENGKFKLQDIKNGGGFSFLAKGENLSAFLLKIIPSNNCQQSDAKKSPCEGKPSSKKSVQKVKPPLTNEPPIEQKRGKPMPNLLDISSESGPINAEGRERNPNKKPRVDLLQNLRKKRGPLQPYILLNAQSPDVQEAYTRDFLAKLYFGDDDDITPEFIAELDTKEQELLKIHEQRRQEENLKAKEAEDRRQQEKEHQRRLMEENTSSKRVPGNMLRRILDRIK